MKRFTLVAIICTLVVQNGKALAVPSSVGLGAFGAGSTVVNFNTIANEQLITSQYAGLGVTFSGALYGMTNSGDTSLFPSNGGGVIASNWLYSQGRHQGTTFTATFTNPQLRVGFYAETNPADDTNIAVFLGANPQGAILFNTFYPPPPFIGLEDPAGFTKITVTVVGPDNNFIAIDDFRFEAVPEPSTLMLLASTSLLFATRRRRA